VSSLVFLLWDIVVTSQNEMKHIWSKPWNSFFKWLYLYLRYVSLAAQIFHQFAVPYLNSGLALRSNCVAWYAYTAILVQLHITAFETILAVRVYALFNRSRIIAIILGSQMTVEYILLVVMVGIYFPRITIIPYCLLSAPPYQIVYHTQVLLFSTVVLITQATLLGLTLFKHTLAKRAGWGRTPLFSLVVRDGTAAFFIVCVIFLNTASFCQLRDERTVVIFFWIVSIISSCGCRLIVNMQSLVVDENGPCSHITSQIEVEPSQTY
ncbi:hypothetical protein K503DRAFT_691598, partial [Rhizopogon vinicolor AM-OR11-026]